MNRRSIAIETLACIALASAASIVTTAAAAEPAATADIEGITVEAARPGRSTIGAPINVVTTQRVINYADLSLTTPTGVKVLEARIRDAAKAACGELDQKYPIDAKNSPNCVNNAVEGAMAYARAAISAAKEENPTAAATIPAIEAREEVTVEAVRGRRASNGAPIRDVTATRAVRFADISLTTPSGAKVLENRIREAARSACNELEQNYPAAVDGDNVQKCLDNAIASAMVVARQAVEAAKLVADTK